MKFKIGDKVILKNEKELLRNGFTREENGYRKDSIFLNDSMIKNFREVTITNYDESYGYDISIDEDSRWSWSSEFFKFKVPIQLELFDEI